MCMRSLLHGLRRLSLAACLVLLPAYGMTQQPPPMATTSPTVAPATDERTTLRQERAQLDAALKVAEAACQRRFAVEDCLRAERRKSRQAKDALRTRQNQLDLLERRERAEQRLQSIEMRQREHGPTGEARLPTAAQRPRAHPENRRATPPLAIIRAERQSRQHEAALRAAQAQQQQREKQAAAQEHKQRVQQAQAERAQRGLPVAAPLPTPK